MKDFDVERNARPRVSVEDRTFRLGGEVFVARDRIRPEAMVSLSTIRDARTDPTRCDCGHMLHEHRPKPGAEANGRPVAGACGETLCGCVQFTPLVVEEATPIHEQIAILDGAILDMIEDGDDAHARYRAMREREGDPVELIDLSSVVQHLMAVTTGRPTVAPSGSSDGRSPTETASTAASSSPDMVAA